MHDPHVPPRRFTGIRRKISLFMLTAVLGVAGAVTLVAYKQGAFVRHTSIYFYAADVFGINKGMSVRLFGLPVGSVRDLQIADRGVKVELSIMTEYVPRVPKSSTVRLTREGYIGAGNIQIVPGGDPMASSEPVHEGDVIAFVPNRGVAELVEDIKVQLTPMVNEMRRMFAEMNAPGGDLRKSLQGASVVFQQLPETNREMREVLRDADRAVRSTQTAMASAARVTDRLEKDLPEVTAKLGTALESLAGAANEIRTVARSNGDALHETLRDGQEVMGAAKSSWLIRDYIESPAMRTLPVDSFESFGAAPEVKAVKATR
ncbi:MAG TPA: MlaD family protein [Burkholderiales bacterium]|nr:MlaD family protein [Burkholderiales bacterium]